VSHQATVAPDPGEGPLDNPATPDELEPAFLVRTLDDLQGDLLSRQIGGKPVAAIAAIGKDVLDEGKQATGLLDEVYGGVPVPNVCWDDLDPKQQSYRIGKRVALDPLTFFPAS
jgi:hypothetical protein